MTSGSSLTEYAVLFAYYLLLVNAWEYLLFAWDKNRARNGGWRVSESTLLFLALVGGSLGAVAGQRILRHKTRKQPFRTYLLLIVVLQSALIVLLSIPAVRSAVGAAAIAYPS